MIRVLSPGRIIWHCLDNKQDSPCFRVVEVDRDGDTVEIREWAVRSEIPKPNVRIG